MKNLIFFSCALVCIIAFGSDVSAFQEVRAVVTYANMDNRSQICTIAIDRQHHRTTQTVSCQNRTFSWRCLPKDYRLSLAEQSRDTNQTILIRYSEYSCENNTGHMLLLTVW
jgi:hypothetical protein